MQVGVDPASRRGGCARGGRAPEPLHVETRPRAPRLRLRGGQQTPADKDCAEGYDKLFAASRTRREPGLRSLSWPLVALVTLRAPGLAARTTTRRPGFRRVVYLVPEAGAVRRWGVVVVTDGGRCPRRGARGQRLGSTSGGGARRVKSSAELEGLRAPPNRPGRTADVLVRRSDEEYDADARRRPRRGGSAERMAPPGLVRPYPGGAHPGRDPARSRSARPRRVAGYGIAPPSAAYFSAASASFYGASRRRRPANYFRLAAPRRILLARSP